MKYLKEFRDRQLTTSLIKRLEESVTGPMRIMEVCGTHTMAIFRNGLRSLLPEELELVSGPGCPVCVTSAGHIDAFISMADQPRNHLAVFGDLFRVPGSNGSLSEASSRGARVDIVYSPMDALELAVKNPDELVVFLGVGFETTTPAVAATIMAANVQKIDNFIVFSTQKVMPPPLHALLGDPELNIDGLLCPGHVSAIIGSDAYLDFAKQYGLSCVVAGFEAADILQGLIMLGRQHGEGRAEVENGYTRLVSREGNRRARDMVDEVFEAVDSPWRGLGVIKDSGLAIREKYEQFDAEKRLKLTIEDVEEPKGCLCGQVLKGICRPPDCPLFGRRCTETNPIGPCMVSSEGTCAAYYKYGTGQ
ncbi:MAG: hydrogenase formation protein HypD [Thermodesulfobacteriota bacterium]